MKPGWWRQPVRAFRGPEGYLMREFSAKWVAMLWAAMQKTGEGYRHPKKTKDAPRSHLMKEVELFDKRLTRGAQHVKEVEKHAV